MKTWRASALAWLACAVVLPAGAQIYSVPMKGLGNEWVKKLSLKGRMDWEWIETYPEQVYFATRQDARRDGDTVTMWIRVEYKYPQSPSDHRSVASRDAWDCKGRRRAAVGNFFYKWNNLEDDDPEHSTNLLLSYEKVEPGTVGETLLQFACSIEPVQVLVPVAPPAARKP